MFSTFGFEENDYNTLVKKVARYRVECSKFDKDDEYLVIADDDGDEIYATDNELDCFNKLVRIEMDLIEEYNYNNRSDSQKYSDYMCDRVDDNWKDRE